MAQAMVQVRVDKELKDRVSSVYEAVGMDLPTAIRMFFKKSILVGGLPFDGRISTADYIVNRQDQMREEVRQRAIEAVEALRAQAAQRPEMTLDEINAEIAAARQERREREAVRGQDV